MTEKKPFMKVKEIVLLTGLSEFYIRKGIKNGTIPHIRCGTSILIDADALIEHLHSEAQKSVGV